MIPTKTSQTSRILQLLKQKKVVSNRDLNRICFRYGARLHELRNDGYLIVTQRTKGSSYNFIYKGHVDDVLEYGDVD